MTPARTLNLSVTAREMSASTAGRPANNSFPDRRVPRLSATVSRPRRQSPTEANVQLNPRTQWMPVSHGGLDVGQMAPFQDGASLGTLGTDPGQHVTGNTPTSAPPPHPAYVYGWHRRKVDVIGNRRGEEASAEFDLMTRLCGRRASW